MTIKKSDLTPSTHQSLDTQGSAMLFAMTTVVVITSIAFYTLGSLNLGNQDPDAFVFYNATKIIKTNLFTLMTAYTSMKDTMSAPGAANVAMMNCYLNPTTSCGSCPYHGSDPPPIFPVPPTTPPAAQGGSTSCGPLKIMYHVDGQLGAQTYYDETVSTNGFTLAGVPCNTYGNAASNNLDGCPIKVNLMWASECPSSGVTHHGATWVCEKMHVYAQFSSSLVLSSPINPLIFNSAYVNGVYTSPSGADGYLSI